MSIIVATEDTPMAGFLICLGALAMIVGLAAVIAGNLQYFGIMRRKKDEPCAPR
ncbi:MAG TPA: hypothetical protein VLK82_26630 [Candidatus Tectomicrobia bacterium]|nr:hypothetical protein [Candidatus Tectomicrobia bacterium]